MQVRDAIGAYCPKCKSEHNIHVEFNIYNARYWSWRKSQYMHEKASGHKMRLFGPEVIEQRRAK